LLIRRAGQEIGCRNGATLPLLFKEGGVDVFLRREEPPYARDAWYDPGIINIGYEISFNRHFYKQKALSSLEEFCADLLMMERETEGLFGNIIGNS
jgi:type I restriction enzyme M protein